MPRPKEGESQQDYVSRFMASEEARKDYPDEKQRAAVAYSLWEHRNVLQNATDWPKRMKGRHLEPGLVRYNDLTDPETGKPLGPVTLLLPKETIDRMRPTVEGRPIINEAHASVNPNWYNEGKADGIAIGGHFNGDDGWEWLEGFIWDDATKLNAKNGYEFSCAYVPTKVRMEPGMHHAIPYDGVIENGRYTHFAVVEKPRYKGASIILNALGGNMFKMLFKKAGVDSAVELDPKTEIGVDNAKVPLLELVNAYKAEEAAKAKIKSIENAEALNDDSMIDMDGKQMPLKALKDSYRNQLKNKEDEEKKKKEAEEAKNAEAAKEKEKKEKEEAEAKNAADKKAADEKAAADAKAAKEAELKNAADEKAQAVKKAGETFFNKLQEVANTRGEARKIAAFTSTEDKVRLGRERYGSAVPASK